MDSIGYDYIYKIIIIGDSGVGKSNILSRFIKGEFEIDSKHTIGVEFSAKTLTIDNKTIKIQVWDTAGQERYRAITNAYYRGANGALIVYDITKRGTFDNLNRWIGELLEHTQNNQLKNIPFLLVGNKADLCQSRQVSTDEGILFSKNHKTNDIHFIETSAMTDLNIDHAFNTLIKNIYESQSKETIDNDDTNDELSSSQSLETDINDNKSSKKYNCCKI